MKRRRIDVSFTDDEIDLYEYILSKGRGSFVLKQMAKNDQKEATVNPLLNELIEEVADLKFQNIDLILAIKELTSQINDPLFSNKAIKTVDATQPEKVQQEIDFSALDDL